MLNNSYSKIGLILITLALTSCLNNNDEIIGYIEGEYLYMSSPVAGYLGELIVKRGQQVEKGQLLFHLQTEVTEQDTKIATQNVLRAQAEFANLTKGERPSELEALVATIAKAEAQLTLAELDVQRAELLVGDGVVDQEDFDRFVNQYHAANADLNSAKANYQTALLGAREDQQVAAEAQLEAMRAALHKANWLNEQRRIVAPTDAIVFDTYYLPGEWIPSGKPVLALLAPAQIDAIFFVPQQELSQIQIGGQVIITCDQCADNITAQIVYISPQAEFTPPVIYDRKERDKLVYKVKAQFDTDTAEQFHPGQPINVILK